MREAVLVHPGDEVVLGGLVLLGVIAWVLSDRRYDVWWVKYVLYTIDVMAVCAMFAFFPVSRGADVPQILAFRSTGISFLFPFVALASLSLSWRLVAWTGVMCMVGWWAAFLYVVSGMERTLSWADMPVGGGMTYASSPAEEYQETLDKAAGLLAAVRAAS